ncbi:MFS transporter [Paenibacillus ginsengarvi]|uniref:MFS transporter n=1 Tax=Paenibacillus ginsengarvi TaxID=400777 RepID=A0A3B0CJ71_9BACL|nr:MFS transporter [Paenibacillus ginsengarvi]RKN85443.1 MFS transporter [Paenibacillus ginsengarvi]
MNRTEEHVSSGTNSEERTDVRPGARSLVKRRSASAQSRHTAFLLASAGGMAVANVYYAQPLLDAISDDFGMAHWAIGIVITVTQICYALGLMLLVPLGDLLNQRRLIITHMFLMAVALIAVGASPSGAVLLLGMAAVGFLAVVTQSLVAFAATITTPAERGRIIGLVTSGIVIGILLARTVAGVLTDLAGWRSVYFVSAIFMLLMAAALVWALPHVERRQTPLSYPQLIRSVFALFAQEPPLLIRGMLGLFIFTAFSSLWTSMVFPLTAPQHSLSHSAIGAFGLAGVAGALAAAQAGRWADRGLGQKTTGGALLLLLAAWVPLSFTEHSLWWLLVGVIVLDFAVQAVHVTNQSILLSVRPEARSRLTAAYMIFYSVGSATGSIASTAIYARVGWSGVCLLGAAVSALALLFWAVTRR